MTDKDLIAAFLAKKDPTIVAAAPAYGVDQAADKERRRAQRETVQFERIERAAENRFQAGVEASGYYKS